MRQLIISIALGVCILLGLQFGLPKKTYVKSRNELIDHLAVELNIPKKIARFAVQTELGNRIGFAIAKKKWKQKQKEKEDS